MVEMKKKNQIIVFYKQKMAWSVLSIRKVVQASPTCPLVTTILAPSSTINYIDIIKSKLFLCITHYQAASSPPSLLSNHNYFFVFCCFLPPSCWKQVFFKKNCNNSFDKCLFVVDTVVQMFTCCRCCSVPLNLLLGLRNLFHQLLEMVAADDSHVWPVRKSNSVKGRCLSQRLLPFREQLASNNWYTYRYNGWSPLSAFRTTMKVHASSREACESVRMQFAIASQFTSPSAQLHFPNLSQVLTPINKLPSKLPEGKSQSLRGYFSEKTTYDIIQCQPWFQEGKLWRNFMYY